MFSKMDSLDKIIYGISGAFVSLSMGLRVAYDNNLIAMENWLQYFVNNYLPHGAGIVFGYMTGYFFSKRHTEKPIYNITAGIISGLAANTFMELMTIFPNFNDFFQRTDYFDDLGKGLMIALPVMMIKYIKDS